MTNNDLPRARQALERARSLGPENYRVRLLWALQLALEGNRQQAVRELDPEVLKYGELVHAASIVAATYAALGDKARSLDWLDRAVRAGDERAEWFQRDPLLASIRQEPRFRQILDAIRYRRQQRARANQRLRNRGQAGYNIPQVFGLDFVYESPSGKSKKIGREPAGERVAPAGS